MNELTLELIPEEMSVEMGDISISGEVDVRPLSVTENGTYSESGVAYAPVVVDVAGFVPTGEIDITENGTFNVAEKATANVSVKQWDDELAEILDGTATELTDLPSGVTKIKPYAFYSEGESRVPSGYKELEYAQSAGSLYVLSNMTFSSDTPYKIIIDMQGTDTNDSVGVGWNAGGGVYFRGDKYSNGLQSSVTSYSSSKRLVMTIEIGTDGTSTYTYADTDGTVLETQTRSNTSLASWAQVNYPLFAITMSASASPQWGYYRGRIFSFKAYKNGVLVCDFVPASRNGEVGFYNLVNDTFLTRTGSGNLIGGDVVPPQYAEHSIESADLNNVTEIGGFAFCNNRLSSLTLRANQVVTLGEYALDGTPIAEGTGHIYVPDAFVEAYKADSQWSPYADYIEAIPA